MKRARQGSWRDVVHAFTDSASSQRRAGSTLPEGAEIEHQCNSSERADNNNNNNNKNNNNNNNKNNKNNKNNNKLS